jgi:hypothetical protein
MTEEKKKLTKQRGRPKKAPMKPLVERPTAFEEGSLFLPTELKIGKKSRFDGKSVTYAFFFREIPHSAQV